MIKKQSWDSVIGVVVFICAYSLRSFLVYMLNIFAIFSLLLAPIDGVIPLIFQFVHRFFWCLYLSTKSACSSHKWAPLNDLRAACLSWKPEEDSFWPSYFSLDLSAPHVFIWTCLPLLSLFGFLGFFFCFVPATHFSVIPPLQDSHSVGVCIDLASVWWTLNFSVCVFSVSPPPLLYQKN